MRQDLAGRKRTNKTRKRSGLVAFASCLLTCFTAAPAFAYRTGEDSPALAGRGRVAWTSPQVGFAMNEASLPRGVSKEQLEGALAQAMDAWTASDCSAIAPFFTGWVSQAALAGDGKNTIELVDGWV